MLRLGLALLLLALMSGCGGGAPIRVGFAGELTGRNADLGVQGRNGALLAVERINAEGGVVGRPLELVVRDDGGTPEGARAADQALIDAGVVAIIGHMTSRQSMAAVPLINAAGVVLLSPTTSTPELSALKDYFFRVNPVNALSARAMARRIFQDRGLCCVAIIYDIDNAAYTRVYRGVFEEASRELGGRLTGEVTFSSAAEPDFGALVGALRANDPAGLLIVASAVDAALIAQQVRLAGWDVPLFAAGWAQTEALLQNGGTAVEGMEVVTNFNSNSQTPAFLDFRARYEERFGREPTFAAAQSYEAVLFLAAALEKSDGRAEDLPQALVETRIQGLTDVIAMDAYGDVVRPQYLLVVRDGVFVTEEVLEPEAAP
ncbi:MAG: ABC transporter substrate-binding protein [Anaerolineae bacterium]